MNRQIKFRAWDKQLNKFINPDFIGRVNFADESYIFQQFTGLKDKAGCEIYEGDIIEYIWQSGYKQLEDGIGEVYFEDGIFFFDKKMQFASNDCNFLKEDIKIIGNIFENPDLLKY